MTGWEDKVSRMRRRNRAPSWWTQNGPEVNFSLEGLPIPARLVPAEWFRERGGLGSTRGSSSPAQKTNLPEGSRWRRLFLSIYTADRTPIFISSRCSTHIPGEESFQPASCDWDTCRKLGITGRLFCARQPLWFTEFPLFIIASNLCSASTPALKGRMNRFIKPVVWCGIGVCESLPQVLKAAIYWSLLITLFLFSKSFFLFFFFLSRLPLTKALGLGKKTAVRERLVSVISLLCASSNFETSLSKQNSCGPQCGGQSIPRLFLKGDGFVVGEHPENMLVPEAFCTWLHNPRRNSQGEPSFIFSRGQSFGLRILILHCGTLAHSYCNGPWCWRCRAWLGSPGMRSAVETPGSFLDSGVFSEAAPRKPRLWINLPSFRRHRGYAKRL